MSYSRYHTFEEEDQTTRQKPYSKSRRMQLVQHKLLKSHPTDDTSKYTNQGCPTSPHTNITSEDIRTFEEEIQSDYGVTNNDGNEMEIQLSRERRRLLNELRVPLNKCGSKFIVIGMNPFDEFLPSVQILKSGVESGISFSEDSFRSFIARLPKILSDLKEGVLYFEDETYTLSYVGPDTCKFIPKSKTSKFELYVMYSTLFGLLEMKEFFINKIDSIRLRLLDFRNEFDNFCYDVVEQVVKSDNMYLQYSVIVDVLKSMFNDRCLLCELVYKFNTYVLNKIKTKVDDDVRVRSYFVQM